jgi:hypothetical protein
VLSRESYEPIHRERERPILHRRQLILPVRGAAGTAVAGRPQAARAVESGMVSGHAPRQLSAWHRARLSHRVDAAAASVATAAGRYR